MSYHYVFEPHRRSLLSKLPHYLYIEKSDPAFHSHLPAFPGEPLAAPRPLSCGLFHDISALATSAVVARHMRTSQCMSHSQRIQILTLFHLHTRHMHTFENSISNMSGFALAQLAPASFVSITYRVTPARLKRITLI